MIVNASIYALLDVRTGEIRYVGKTIRSTSVRLGQHRRDTAATHKARWIQAVGPGNVTLRILATVPKDQAGETERRWISNLRAAGVRLTNITPGGEGGPGAAYGSANPMKRPEVVAKVMAYPRRRDALWRSRISASHMGKRMSDECRAKMSAAHKGVPKTSAHNAAVSAAQKARYGKMSPERRSEIVQKGWESRRRNAAR